VALVRVALKIAAEPVEQLKTLIVDTDLFLAKAQAILDLLFRTYLTIPRDRDRGDIEIGSSD
jgi:hypothetical protein